MIGTDQGAAFTAVMLTIPEGERLLALCTASGQSVGLPHRSNSFGIITSQSFRLTSRRSCLRNHINPFVTTRLCRCNYNEGFFGSENGERKA